MEDKRHESAAKTFIRAVWQYMPKGDRLKWYQFSLWMDNEAHLSELKEKLAKELYPNDENAQETFVYKDVEPTLEKISDVKNTRIASKIDSSDPLFILKSIVQGKTYEGAKQSLMKMNTSSWLYKGGRIKTEYAEKAFEILYKHAMGETFYDVKWTDDRLTLSDLKQNSNETNERIFVQRYAGFNKEKFPDKVKVWRGTNSPLNQIKAGDFVTFDKDYAESYTRGKFGAVVSSTLPSSELKVYKMDIDGSEMIYWPENHQIKTYTGKVPTFKEFWAEFR